MGPPPSPRTSAARARGTSSPTAAPSIRTRRPSRPCRPALPPRGRQFNRKSSGSGWCSHRATSSGTGASAFDTPSGAPVPSTFTALPVGRLMTRRTAIGLLVFCALGLAASGLSAYVHYRLLTEPGYTSFCSINATWNCESVYESRFGAFRGVPVAVGGIIWFTGATMLVLAGWRGANGPAVAATSKTARARKASTVSEAPARFGDYALLYLFVWSVVGLAFVMYFGYASFVV